MPEFVMPRYAAFLDTNAVFNRRPGVTISDHTRKLLQECSKLAVIQFSIPQVVRDELCFQRFRPAQEALSRALQNVSTIRECSGISLDLPHAKRVRQDVEAKVAAELKSAGLLIVPLPVRSIDWDSVVADACWRECVFENDSTTNGTPVEKGFRDRMALETIFHAAQALAKHKPEIAVITKDRLLRESLQARFKGEVTPTFWDDLEVFHSGLKLLSETASRQWTVAVTASVTRAFFAPNDPECLFRTWELEDRIVSAFRFEVCREHGLEATPFASLKIIGNLALPNFPAGGFSTFRRVGGLRLKIGHTLYERFEADDLYYWKTTVELVCMFQRDSGSIAMQAFSGDSAVRVVDVSVLWRCRVNDRAEPSEFEFVDFASQEERVVRATQAVRDEYDLPPIAMLRHLAQEEMPDDSEVRLVYDEAEVLGETEKGVSA